MLEFLHIEVKIVEQTEPLFRYTTANRWVGSLWMACALAVPSVAWAQGSEIVLYSFTGGADGGNPQSPVIRDSAGSLYGTTRVGGASNQGVVYRLDATGHETALYSFTGGADGAHPYAGLILDSAGNLYGTTYRGGPANAGVVYKVDVAGYETVLYAFTGGADGGNPYAGVIRDSTGNLYGTTLYGGAANAGVVYELEAAGHETVLYPFTGGADGGNPYAGVIRDSAGNLYGTTHSGGINPFGTGDLGVVYKVDATGHETVLYSCPGGADDGCRYPVAGVIHDSHGNLYGTTAEGGTGCLYGCGVVFKLDASGNETPLYSFTGGPDGAYPLGGVILDAAGNLYGTTSHGVTTKNGAVYKLDGAGQSAVLYSFTGGADGGQPYSGLIRDSDGNLYGTTLYGGTNNAGVVFEIPATSTMVQ